jgi:perosamine synthetase
MKTIPWWSPQIGPRELELVKEVLESGYVNEGEVTERFERQIADLLGARHAVAATSGTSALFLALTGLGIAAGDEVIVPDVTFIATANAVRLCGATPVLVDVDPRTLNIDVGATERAITSRTKGVIPVHVTGRGADMKSVCALAKTYGLVVVEDAAEALRSKHAGRWLGTWGDAGCFSFSPAKTITAGQGGMVVTDDDALAGRIRALKDQGRPTRGTGGDDLHPTLGFNFKFTNLQAAVALGQLHYLEQRVARQRAIHAAYVSELEGVKGIDVIRFDLEGGACPQWTDALCDRRDQLELFLRARGAMCRKLWHPVHTQAPYREPDDRFPNAVAQCPRALWLPSAFTLTDEDVATVSRHIRSFYEGSMS